MRFEFTIHKVIIIARLLRKNGKEENTEQTGMINQTAELCYAGHDTDDVRRLHLNGSVPALISG